jgi:AmiR/NasT family two-component response regulator
MKFAIDIPNFRTWSAAIVHRSHADADAVARQLERIGVSVRQTWPELDPGHADVVFFDADLGYDAQFAWTPGEAPMPLIALLGSETPGRVEWAMSQGANAHLLKPIGSAGVYSALVIASHSYVHRKRLFAEVGELRERLRRRPNIARAVIAIMQGEQVDEVTALGRLRRMAMSQRHTIEDAAEIVIANYGGRRDARDRA